MTASSDQFRAHIVRLLDWEEAHATFDKAVADLSPDSRGALAPGFEHSPWQLLEHLRIAQSDILDFCSTRSTFTTGHGRTTTGRRIPRLRLPARGTPRSRRIAPIARR